MGVSLANIVVDGGGGGGGGGVLADMLNYGDDSNSVNYTMVYGAWVALEKQVV